MVIFIYFIFFLLRYQTVSIVTAREVEPCASKHHQWDSVLSTRTVLQQEAACLMWSWIPAVERAKGHHSLQPPRPQLCCMHSHKFTAKQHISLHSLNILIAIHPYQCMFLINKHLDKPLGIHFNKVSPIISYINVTIFWKEEKIF